MNEKCLVCCDQNLMNSIDKIVKFHIIIFIRTKNKEIWIQVYEKYSWCQYQCIKRNDFMNMQLPLCKNKSIAQVITKGVVLLDKQSAFFTKTTACKSNC